ncbi:autophagy-related protein 17 [Acrasis kona]|uniref:Autophagy-related protein 17 n=1 Tax=Acrasis kona TaxID=1008807 RepID=A0AAW2Z2Q1_9EUKA
MSTALSFYKVLDTPETARDLVPPLFFHLKRRGCSSTPRQYEFRDSHSARSEITPRVHMTQKSINNAKTVSRTFVDVPVTNDITPEQVVSSLSVAVERYGRHAKTKRQFYIGIASGGSDDSIKQNWLQNNSKHGPFSKVYNIYSANTARNRRAAKKFLQEHFDQTQTLESTVKDEPTLKTLIFIAYK